tara:strand:+ start:342 stop:914 length:573 start_codon:yes stop_codon:yes gene_type:complete
MSNQYWKNKIQLKEAYERGQQDNLTEGPLRGLSQIAQTITDPKIAKRLRNLLRNVLGPIADAPPPGGFTMKFKPKGILKTGVRTITIPQEQLDRIREILGPTLFEEFMTVLQQFLKRGGVMDNPTGQGVNTFSRYIIELLKGKHLIDSPGLPKSLSNLPEFGTPGGKAFAKDFKEITDILFRIPGLGDLI